MTLTSIFSLPLLLSHQLLTWKISTNPNNKNVSQFPKKARLIWSQPANQFHPDHFCTCKLTLNNMKIIRTQRLSVMKQRETQISIFINCGMQEPSGLTSRVVWATHQYEPGWGAAKAPLARAQFIVKGGSWKHWGKYSRTDNSVKPTSLSFPAYSKKIRGLVLDYFTQHQSIAYFISSRCFSRMRIPLSR